MTQPNFKQILPFVVPTISSNDTVLTQEEPLPLKAPSFADNDVLADNDVNDEKNVSGLSISPSSVTIFLAAIGLAITGWIFADSSFEKVSPPKKQIVLNEIPLVSLPVISPSTTGSNETSKTVGNLQSAPVDANTLNSTIQKTEDTANLPLPEPKKLQIPPVTAVSSTVQSTAYVQILASPNTNIKDMEQAVAFTARARRIMRETKDIGAARLFLDRALILGDQNAALYLGETYDPMFLKQQGAKGISGDVTRAKELYQRAADNGIEEAKRKLNELR